MLQRYICAPADLSVNVKTYQPSISSAIARDERNTPVPSDCAKKCQQGPSPAAREKLGKRFRAQWRTLGWSGLGRRGSEEAPPRRSRDDGEVEYKTCVIFEMKKC